MKSITCVAPINIAVIKYWGKDNEDLNIPLNSSISVTLDLNDLCATTTLSASEDYEQDEMSLNGKSEDIDKNERIQRCLNEVHREMKCKITSSNNFPTAAGLASSAAGYACLAKCLGTVYSYKKDISILARLGSGSACRSMYGGFVKWVKGTCPKGSDSLAVQIADEHHWPELRSLILVVSSKEKSVGSTIGMKRSVETSGMLKYRVNNVLNERIEAMEEAILQKDFKTFAEITMKDSNQLHAICQDTYPPISPPYMSTTSHHIVQLVTKFNQGSIKAAYTFDAGPNAVLFTLEHDFDELLATITQYFPSTNMERYINLSENYLSSLSAKALELQGLNTKTDSLQRIICTKPGKGASIMKES